MLYELAHPQIYAFQCYTHVLQIYVPTHIMYKFKKASHY